MKRLKLVIVPAFALMLVAASAAAEMWVVRPANPDDQGYRVDEKGWGTTVRPTLRNSDLPDPRAPGWRIDEGRGGEMRMRRTLPGSDLPDPRGPDYRVFER